MATFGRFKLTVRPRDIIEAPGKIASLLTSGTGALTGGLDSLINKGFKFTFDPARPLPFLDFRSPEQTNPSPGSNQTRAGSLLGVSDKSAINGVLEIITNPFVMLFLFSGILLVTLLVRR